MAKAATKSDEANAPPKPTVAVVGGGLAGLTAALRLAQRGFAVTIYEAKHTLGGNLSANKVNGVFHDVYPHMFCAWYANFWQIFKDDLGLERDEQFEARDGVKLQDKNATTYQELENGTTIKSLMANLNSGVASIPDLFLFGFSMLDLAATPFQRSGADLLERLDVNGFIYSRGYTNENVAALQNYILMVIWSIQSDVTAAASYQDFIKHSMLFPNASPFCWLLKGSLYERIIEPFERKLWSLDCDIRKGATVTSVVLADGPSGKATLTVETAKTASGGAQAKTVTEQVSPDYVVMAVPGPALATLAMGGKVGERLVDAVPQLSEVRRFWGEAIPVVDIYFNKKLPGVPQEQVGLKQSDCDLTMLDISQLWTGYPDMADRTVLVVAASNNYALTSEDEKVLGFEIIKKLHDGYLPAFNTGKYWGDTDSDIDWDKSLARSNYSNLLFVNDVGSWQWRPVASYDGLSNVFIAGDFCQSDVDMATIEAAVQSGLAAAQATQARDMVVTGALRGQPISPAPHEIYSDVVFLALKLALLPFAYAATAWSALDNERPLIGRVSTVLHPGAAESSTKPQSKAPQSLKAAPANAYSPLTYSLLLPVAFSLDWWKTVYWLARKLAPSTQPTPGGAAPADADVTVGLFAYTESMARALWEYAQAPTKEPAPKPHLAEALATFTRQAARTVQAAYAAVEPLYDPASYSRRWRAKQ